MKELDRVSEIAPRLRWLIQTSARFDTRDTQSPDRFISPFKEASRSKYRQASYNVHRQAQRESQNDSQNYLGTRGPILFRLIR